MSLIFRKATILEVLPPSALAAVTTKSQGVIIQACWENGIDLSRIAKMSGIGCSSKPCLLPREVAWFNTVHGRMPSVTTGANMVNKDLVYLGVSGDGDSASIGIGQFIHAIRRNLNMVYIIENNGVYGLTKGQYSATVQKASKKESGAERAAPHRYVQTRHQSRMRIRRTVLLRCEEAADCPDEGCPESQRDGCNRRDLPLRDLRQ